MHVASGLSHLVPPCRGIYFLPPLRFIFFWNCFLLNHFFFFFTLLFSNEPFELLALRPLPVPSSSLSACEDDLLLPFLLLLVMSSSSGNKDIFSDCMLTITSSSSSSSFSSSLSSLSSSSWPTPQNTKVVFSPFLSVIPDDEDKSDDACSRLEFIFCFSMPSLSELSFFFFIPSTSSLLLLFSSSETYSVCFLAISLSSFSCCSSLFVKVVCTPVLIVLEASRFSFLR
mmetsp:Transcript_29423/g.47218  ORF Transcript_29423/g.47218 Transcript_29423/m.47218 type:complete len:228 (-) Transcript_29423:232-915(-)